MSGQYIGPWVAKRLTCTECGKTAYRPANSARPCEWCGGALVATRAGQFELFPETA